MSLQYLGEIRIVSFPFAPKGWALCNGQTMPINQNQALFSLLGTTFGGNGINTFMLPDFRGRAPLHAGSQQGTPAFTPGQMTGEEQHTLLSQEMGMHTHTALASTGGAGSASPSGNSWASSTTPPQYAGSPINALMANNAIAMAGGSQPHENRPPYLVLNFIIALTGIFPSRN
jgi:microcystin-dependent protein